MQRLVCQQTQLKLDALWDGKPMKAVPQHVLDMILVAKVITNKLQRVMNAASRVLTGTRKFDCGSTQLMHDNFLWLDVPEHVVYKVNISTRRCLIGTAPRCLAADSVILGLVMIFSVKV